MQNRDLDFNKFMYNKEIKDDRCTTYEREKFREKLKVTGQFFILHIN